MALNPIRSNLRQPGRARRHEAGNAYLVTVMVMIIVTLLGLSLGAVTQTEMLIGSRERNNQRVFYLAEGGLNLAVARFMVSADQKASRLEFTLPPAYDFSSEGGFGGISMDGVVRLAAIRSPSVLPCQLCDAAAPGEYGSKLKQVRLPITVRASMETKSGQVLAQRRMSTLVDLTPWDGDVSGSSTLDLQKPDIEYN